MGKNIAIIGAGISGLSAAWSLKKKYGDSAKLTVFEKEAFLGGCLRSAVDSPFFFEWGPRSIRTQSLTAELLELIRALDLEDEMIIPPKSANKRYLYEDQRLHPLPSGILGLPFSHLTRGWLRSIFRDLTCSSLKGEDYSIHDFFTHHFGLDWAERLVDPFISGIYAGDPKQLSMKSCFPHLLAASQKQRSLIISLFKSKSSRPLLPPHLKGSPFFSFRKGLGQLPERLAEKGDFLIRFNTRIKKIVPINSQVEITLESGGVETFDEVYSAAPFDELSRYYAPLADCQIDYTSVYVVNVAFDRKVLTSEGFGYLVSSKQQEPILGCIWDSEIFPQHNQSESETRLTVMMGGVRNPAIEKMDKEEVIQTALETINKHLKLSIDPVFTSAHLARRKIPQFKMGHSEKVEKVKSRLKESKCVYAIGGGLNGVSIADSLLAGMNTVLEKS